MPSTYTALNRLELQNPGENLNTWGAKLNADTTALIDFSLSGVTTLTPSGPITLTSANGVADQARAPIINCTSGTGGTITIPAVSHVYQVRNNCSGNLIFTTGSGTTATVEAGSSATVISDGTNCYRFTDAADIAACLAASKAYTDAAAFSSASGNLPGQAGNAGKYLTTNGSVASWASITAANVTAALGFTPGPSLGFTPLNPTNNLSDLSNPGTARTNLGVAQVGMDATYNFRANNLSDVANAATARTNLGVPTGTSGATLPFLNGSNTWSGLQTLSAGGNLTPAATPATNAIGYLGLPQTTRSGNYQLQMADAACEQFFTSTATLTIPANGGIPFPIGTIIVGTADVGATLSVAITSDTLRFVPTNSTGPRTVTGPGYIVLEKKKATEWWCTGVGVA